MVMTLLAAPPHSIGPPLIRTANAPVSYGVFGLAHEHVTLPDGETLLRWVAEAGYDGIDLGAHGLLGNADEIVANLDRHGLALAGGWMDLPFAGDDYAFANALHGLEAVLPVFAAAARAWPDRPPRPTIADAGSAQRRAHPGGGPELELDPQRWRLLAARVQEVADRVRAAGLEPTFHHHACTYVETPAEIERLLADTDIGLTFDSGHLLLGGGDPDADFARWRDRIDHVHLKDCDRTVLEAAAGSPDPMREVWERRAFVALGEGDLEVDGIVQRIVDSGYAGWLVVEQDVVLRDDEDLARARADQVRNRERLRRWFA